MSARAIPAAEAVAQGPVAAAIRKAVIRDVPQMAAIINAFASKGLMLARSQHHLYQFLRDFCVVTVDGQVVGCGALSIVWADTAEVRSLAVAEAHHGRGLGQRMVGFLLAEARELGLPSVFALTYQQGFFERLGFHVVPNDSLPHKIWTDCLNCPKFPNCDEIAMIIQLDHEEESDEG